MYSSLTSFQRKRYLFVCINRRAEDNPKGCCATKDSEEVYRALKAEVAARGLAKLEARVCTSSCLDQCATGVTVLVEPDHFFYGHVTVADVTEIVDGLVKGEPVKRLMLTDDPGKPPCSRTISELAPMAASRSQIKLRPQRSMIAEIVADEASELSWRLPRPQS